MPIYEYKCSDCGEIFEKLVIGLRAAESVRCGSCGSRNIYRLMSRFSAGSASGGGSREVGSSCAPRSPGFS